MSDLELSIQIERLFSSRPRNGADSAVLWHKRGKIERKLSQLLKAKSLNVCIDGPTGSGKSSLALTVLNRIGQPYIWIPLVRELEWDGFCEELAMRAWEISDKINSAKKSGVSVNLQTDKAVSAGELLAPWKLLSRIEFRFSDTSVDKEKARELAKSWTITDVEQFIDQNGICLLIDDFEKATESLVTKIADLCKRLTFHQAPKCIIIGTGNTFSGLYSSDEGLDGRLAELSVASLGTKLEVWNYINDGFEQMGFNTPREKLKNKNIGREQVDKIIDSIFEAADGMPKYINELALDICNSVLDEQNTATQSMNISPEVLFKQSRKMCDQNFSRYRRQISRAEKKLRESVELRSVLKAIFSLGANSVHGVDKVIDFIKINEDEHFSYDQFSSGITMLNELGLYVQTGKSGEVVFAKDPLYAHVLGLVCRDPVRFNKNPQVFGLFGQRSLPLVG